MVFLVLYLDMKKTIYIEGLALVEPHFSGVGQYVLGICNGIDQYIENELLAGGNPPRVKILVPKDKVKIINKYKFTHLDVVTYPFGFRVVNGLWLRGKMPPLDLFFGKGVYIFPRFLSARLLFSKSLVVIYDLSYELHREFSDERNSEYLSNGVRKTLRWTKDVITISENAKRELRDFYQLTDEEVSVATPGIDVSQLYRRSEKEIDYVTSLYKLPRNYILALSNLEPRKNLQSLVDAYTALPHALKKQLPLVIVGVNAWKTDPLLEKIRDTVAQGEVIIRPSAYVRDEHRAAIYSAAAVLVYPSLYEGFGMPPVEALACGAPAITYDNSSLPEAVGKAGRLVSTGDVRSLTEAIAEIVADEAYQKKILITGPAHAQSFSWLESARVFMNKTEDLQ